MRNYQSNTKAKKTGKNQKGMYWALFVVFAAVVAAIIALSITLGGNPSDADQQTPLDPGKEVEVPVNVDTKPKFVLPMEGYALGNLAVLDKLVYNSSLNHWRTHNGIDFISQEGSVVRSVAEGTVLSVDHTQLEAGVIKIAHADGIVSIYKGLSADMRVEAGDKVAAGAAIGTVAASMGSERSVGPHLHLEMTQAGKIVNPILFLPDLEK